MALRHPFKVLSSFFLSLFFVFPLEADPLTKQQLFQMATAAARDGAYETASELYKKVLDADPRFSPAYNSLGLIQQSWEQGSIDEAVRYFLLATDIDPAYTEAWNNLGRAYYSRGQFTSAKTAFLRSLQGKEEQADIHLALAWVFLLGESDADPAIEHFQKALLALDDDMAYYGLGLAYLLAGERFKVLDAITELRRRQRISEANALEKMVRENARISSTKGKPLVTGRDPGGSVFDREMVAVGAPGGKGEKEKRSIPVRLTGPL